MASPTLTLLLLNVFLLAGPIAAINDLKLLLERCMLPSALGSFPFHQHPFCIAAAAEHYEYNSCLVLLQALPNQGPRSVKLLVGCACRCC
jgi:hypothetical protein